MNRARCLCMLLPLLAMTARGAVLDQGDVEFAGYITDEAPRWLWQVATPDQTWDVDVEDARTDAQGRQVFALTGRGTLAFLEGHLKKVAERGGIGMTPVITFTSAGMPLPVMNGGTQTRFRTAIPVTNTLTGEPVGQLSFTLDQGLVTAQGRDVATDPDSTDRNLHLSGMALVTEDGGQGGTLSPQLTGRLSALLGMNEGLVSAGIPVGWRGETVPRQVLGDNRVPQLAGAYASQLSDFELSWPQEQVPGQWRATLSVSVTLQ